MGEVLAKWMTSFLIITVMFSPILMFFDSSNKAAADNVLHQAMKEASIEGHFSDEIVEKIKDKLINEHNFDPDGIIEIKGTPGVVPRGGYIDAEITIKRSPIFVLNIFNQGNPNYTADDSIMSEDIR